MVSPKDSKAFAEIASVRQFTHDESAMRALDQRIKAAGLDHSDEIAAVKEYLDGTKDQQTVTALTAGMKRADEKLPAFRAKGGATAAAAINAQVGRMLSLDLYGVTADADKIITLSEEADHIAPSATTSNTVIAALIFRACRNLRRADPAFDEYAKKYERSLGSGNLLALIASEPGPFQQKVTGDADIQKVVAILRSEADRFPLSRATFEWALLKNIDPAESAKCAESIRKSAPRRVVEESVATQLEPASANEAMDTYWLMQIIGKSDAAQAVRKVASLGIPVPAIP